MDSAPADSAVTLVIKAPNQTHEDQTIHCFLHWTVEKLKRHLSTVYPSRPSSRDQRLVYSGKLLPDHLQLRDVIRTDEHPMMHLLCASRTPPASPPPGRPSPPTDHTGSSLTSAEEASSHSRAGAANQGSPPAPASSPAPGGNVELRNRRAPPQYSGRDPPAPGVTPWPEGAAPPGYTPQQVLWWQQMYARQYYLQYQAAVAAAQSATARPGPALSPPPVQPAPADARVPPAAAPGPDAAAPPPLPPENRPANVDVRMNAQGGAALNDEELNRDWLDRLYAASRAGVLLGVIYFYSSFSRFLAVLAATLLVCLHQAGWFPFRADRRPDPRGGGRDAGQRAEADRQQDIQDMERLMDEGMEEEADGEEEEEEEGGGGDGGGVEPGFLSTAWSFISTFFTSLVPDGPPQPLH